MPWPGSVADYIVIPAVALEMPVSSFALSMRLQNVLGWKECRVMGDLDGLRFSEVARWRNCGKVTVRELLGIIRCLQHGNWKARPKPDTRDMAEDFEV
jgi:hypothetical protein